MATRPIFRFHAELKGVKPRIWGRFEVADSIRMSRLAYVLQILFEMEASHLFKFTVPLEANRRIRAKRTGTMVPRLQNLSEPFRREYSIWLVTEKEDLELYQDGDREASSVQIMEVLDTPGQKLSFEYDFGDGWEVALKLEQIVRDLDLDARALPRALEGEGFGIVEDCGGPGGLMRLAEAFHLRSGPEYEELREWLEQDRFNPERFNLADMNVRLKKLPLVYQRIYEQGKEPSRASLALIQRPYPEI